MRFFSSKIEPASRLYYSLVIKRARKLSSVSMVSIIAMREYFRLLKKPIFLFSRLPQ